MGFFDDKSWMKDSNKYFSFQHCHYFEKDIITEISMGCPAFHLKLDGKYLKDFFFKRVFHFAGWVDGRFLIAIEVPRQFKLLRLSDIGKRKKLLLLDADKFHLSVLEDPYEASIQNIKIENTKLTYEKIGHEKCPEEKSLELLSIKNWKRFSLII